MSNGGFCRTALATPGLLIKLRLTLSNEKSIPISDFDEVWNMVSKF